MVIREYQEKDNKKVSKFFKDIFIEMGWEISPFEGLDNPGEHFYSQNGLILVVEESEDIIGTAGLMPLSDSEILLKRFYIRKDFRGEGISKKLINFTLNTAKSKGFRRMVLDVARDNSRAVHFYQKNNFVQFDTKPYKIWYESNYPKDYFYFKKEL